MMLHRKTRMTFFLVVVALLLLGTSPLFSQLVVEANLGANLFNIADPKITIDTTDNATLPAGWSHTGTADLTVNMPTMAAFGITVGTMLSDMFLGGELAYYSGSAGGGTVTPTGGLVTSLFNANGISSIILIGNVDVSFFRVGPVFRYYFGASGLRPFVGMALDYESTTWTPPSGSISKFTIGVIDIAPMLGIVYDVSPNIYIGAIARFGYFITVSQSDQKNLWKDLGLGYDTEKLGLSWGPVSIVIALGYSL